MMELTICNSQFYIIVFIYGFYQIVLYTMALKYNDGNVTKTMVMCAVVQAILIVSSPIMIHLTKGVCQ